MFVILKIQDYFSSANTVGVIVRLEKELFHVLNMNGKVVKAKPQSIQKKKEARFVQGVDSKGNTIQKRDVVNVVDGAHPERQGEVRHIYRVYAFLYSRMCLENGGIFVCKTNHLELAGGVGMKVSELKFSLLVVETFLTAYQLFMDSLKFQSNAAEGGASLGYMSPRLSSPMHPSSSGPCKCRNGATICCLK